MAFAKALSLHDGIGIRSVLYQCAKAFSNSGTRHPSQAYIRTEQSPLVTVGTEGVVSLLALLQKRLGQGAAITHTLRPFSNTVSQYRRASKWP